MDGEPNPKSPVESTRTTRSVVALALSPDPADAPLCIEWWLREARLELAREVERELERDSDFIPSMGSSDLESARPVERRFASVFFGRGFRALSMYSSPGSTLGSSANTMMSSASAALRIESSFTAFNISRRKNLRRIWAGKVVDVRQPPQTQQHTQHRANQTSKRERERGRERESVHG